MRVGDERAVQPDDGAPPVDRPAQPWRRAGALTVLWIGLLLVMLRPTPHQVAETLPNDLGDPNFVTWTLRWGWRALLTEPWNVFDAPIYFPAEGSLAYSDTLLTLAPWFGAVEALTGDAVVALNVLTVALYALGLVATFVLARDLLGGRTGPAVFAAAAFTFTSYTLGQQSHVQVLTFGMFPLGIWLLLRFVDRGRPLDAAALAAVTVGFVYGAIYYALLWLLVAPGLVVVLLLAGVRPPRATWLRGLAAGLAAVVVSLPAGIAYLSTRARTGVSFAYVDIDSLQWRDLLTPAAGNDLWGNALDGINSVGVPGDHGFMVSMTVYVLAAVGAVLVVARRGRVDPDDTDDAEGSSICGGGVVQRGQALVAVVAVAVGSLIAGIGPTFQGYKAPYRLLHRFVPGFDGIRSASRLSIVFFLGLALVAAVGLAWLADRATRWRGARLGHVLVALVLVVAMAEVSATRSRTDAWRPEGVLELYAAVEDMPPGAVLEWPIFSITDLVAWPFVEAPRMALVVDPDHPRVNGYSGHWPEGFVEDSRVLRTFPDRPALDLLDEMGVRYVVVHATSPWEGAPLDRAEAEAVAAAVPEGFDVTPVGEGWVVDLRPDDLGR